MLQTAIIKGDRKWTKKTIKRTHILYDDVLYLFCRYKKNAAVTVIPYLFYMVPNAE